MKTPMSVPQLLGATADASLQTVLQRVQELLRLEKAVLELLEPPLKSHCRVANLRDETLVLFTDSPVWATRLRFQGPNVLARLRQTPIGARVRRLDVKVKLAASQPRSSVDSLPKLSARTVALLRDVAQLCEEDALRNVFLRLSGRG